MLAIGQFPQLANNRVANHSEPPAKTRRKISPADGVWPARSAAGASAEGSENIKEKAKGHRSFRLWDENQTRLDWAVAAGINASEVVNQVLADHLKPYLEKARAMKSREVKEALAMPVP